MGPGMVVIKGRMEMLNSKNDIPASNSTYFEVPVEAASNYRVSVFAYDWIETDGPRR